MCDVEAARNVILELEEAAKRAAPDARQQEYDSTTPDERYPIFHDVVAVMPTFKHAIVLECHRPLVQSSEIPFLLYLLKLPKCAEGLDVENHGFGYHFHYGKVKADVVVRSNLLLTFDPAASLSESGKAPPLFGEYHAEGKNKRINMEAIGPNKRLPIYAVCLHAGKNRGLGNFKYPSGKAVVFHSEEFAA